ncbi:mediator of RNA polymerase II transcription subunit 15 isoform X2 [Drosophila erecta]|uniref:mediator of RNA polymerase II transcription subunit 15 isoform X2 n=1 Tax=Drosophila erecta TaxID=7220 RepID=UPI000F062883|nr:mediator of RNA polymerase II transcription subunit 15 isoform X2 [Drosophila erecta]
MNFCSVPYEADYGMYADSKMKSVPQYPISMGASPGQGQSLAMQPLNPPQMNLQMQMPMSQSGAASYPMQGMPLGMMQGGNQMTPMSTMSTQLPIGAVTPLNSMTMMPMMGNPMGAIDAPGINAVLPDLQPMSSMGQMQALQPLQQYNPTGSTTQMHQGRLAGGCSTGMAAPCPSSPTNPGSWSSSPSSNQMMTNANMWQYSQPMQGHQPQYQQLQHFQQQNQSQPQVSRMKPSYDAPIYRDMRNGLNNPF